jgi:large subunit ribosomal protein L15
MQIHSIPSRNIKTKKRVGRGGKRGTYCGRGMKGQKSRSGGGKIDPLFEGGRSSLIERMKKNRGFKSPHEKKVAIPLSDLERAFQDGDLVSPKTLVRAELVDKTRVKFGVKVLGTGKLTKKLTVAANILLSDTARKAIEKAGGSVEKKEEKKV